MIGRLRYCFLFLSLLLPLSANGQDLDDRLDDAYRIYVAGERAQSNQERSQRFNEALSLYSVLANEYPNVGELQFNTANAYYQLGEYGWAILHYYRALSDLPREERVLNNLNIAAQKAGVPGKAGTTPTEYLLYPHYRMSIGERIETTFLLSLLAFLCWSAYIWGGSGVLRGLATLLTTLAAGILLSLAISQYAAPIEAIVVRSATLHTDAGKHYAEVMERPVLAGSKVIVLEVNEDGRWLKIATPQGIVGFAENDRLRIID